MRVSAVSSRLISPFETPVIFRRCSAPTTRPRAVARTQSRDGRQRISAPDTKLRTAHGVAEGTLTNSSNSAHRIQIHGLAPAVLKGHTDLRSTPASRVATEATNACRQ